MPVTGRTGGRKAEGDVALTEYLTARSPATITHGMSTRIKACLPGECG